MHTILLASVLPGTAAKQYGPTRLCLAPIASGMLKLPVISAPTEVHAALMPELETEPSCQATRFGYRIMMSLEIGWVRLCKSALRISALSIECY